MTSLSLLAGRTVISKLLSLPASWYCFGEWGRSQFAVMVPELAVLVSVWVSVMVSVAVVRLVVVVDRNWKVLQSEGLTVCD